MQRQEPFTLNDPHPMRVSKQLADEIGFIESLLLLQIGYLISISSAQEMGGYRWTYQTAHDLHENYFSFISKQTIARKLKDLEDRGYIISANHNKHKYDRTKWYRINDEGIQHLKSISTFQGDISHSEKCNSPKKKSNSLSETTIPETPTETTTGSKREYPASLEAKDTLSHGASAFDA